MRAGEVASVFFVFVFLLASWLVRWLVLVVFGGNYERGKDIAEESVPVGDQRGLERRLGVCVVGEGGDGGFGGGGGGRSSSGCRGGGGHCCAEMRGCVLGREEEKLNWITKGQNCRIEWRYV